MKSKKRRGHWGLPKARQRDCSHRPVEYPIATIAYYGPDDKTVTKIAVGIVESEAAEPIMERWLGPDVLTSSEVRVQMVGLIEAHGVKQIVVTDGPIGCPHEEGVDFPEGQECPYCPFWRGQRDLHVPDQAQQADPYQAMKALSHQRMDLMWEMGQHGLPLNDEDSRQVKIMREHPEYSHLWGRLSELPDAEIEQGGVSPIMHIVTHTVIENQLALGEPKEVGRALKRLMRSGLSRHEAIHRVGSAWAEEIFYTLRDRRPFDEPAYVRKLQELEW